jgi:hypothetical protein
MRLWLVVLVELRREFVARAHRKYTPLLNTWRRL